MRKSPSFIILIVSILMIIGGYFVYQEFIYPSYLNNTSQEVKMLLNEEQQLLLIKRPEQSRIYSLELEISPNSGSNYTVIIPEVDEAPYEARVKKGKEFVHKLNWQQDSCILTFIPNEVSRDSVTVHYRFLGLNR